MQPSREEYEQRKEWERQEKLDHFRMASKMLEFMGVVLGVVCIFVLLALLFSLVTWLVSQSGVWWDTGGCGGQFKHLQRTRGPQVGQRFIPQASTPHGQGICHLREEVPSGHTLSPWPGPLGWASQRPHGATPNYDRWPPQGPESH